jgi:hypothetical protein
MIPFVCTQKETGDLMAVSKNNPAVRDNQRLLVRSPKTGEELRMVKRVPGGMFWVSDKTGEAFPVRRGGYKDFPHEWVRK